LFSPQPFVSPSLLWLPQSAATLHAAVLVSDLQVLASSIRTAQVAHRPSAIWQAVPPFTAADGPFSLLAQTAISAVGLLALPP